MDKPVKKNEIYEMTIRDFGDGGEGIGDIEGLAVFVQGAVPGDKVKAKIILSKKKYAIARVEEIIEPSSIRVEPECAYFPRCGGCQLQHVAYEEQLKIKEKKVYEALVRIGKVENPEVLPIIGMEQPSRYRNKGQFPVRMDKEGLKIGFYKKGSHFVVDVDDCMLQHEDTAKVVEIIRNFIEASGISIYDEKTHKGTLRHVLVRESFTTGEIMVVVITNGKTLKNKELLIDMFAEKMPKVVSIVQNINKLKGNTVLGPKSRTLSGKDTITDYIGDIKFEISPLSFFQVNPRQTEVLYNKAIDFAGLTGEEEVFDIYSGIGTISLMLAQKARKVVGVEVVPEAILDAEQNAETNGFTNAEFFVGKAEEVIPELYKQGHKADVVVVDPPRKGCEKEVLETMINMNPEKIVYVSCKPSTMARDIQILVEGGYELVKVQPVDMFPWTAHVENIALLVKVD